MRTLFYKLPKNIAECFRVRYLLWHLLAIILTFVFVASGYDWFYFESTRSNIISTLLFPAVILGGFLPLIVPLVMLAVGKFYKNPKVINSAWALGQAALVGLLISSTYKAFTGRVPPEHTLSTVNTLSGAFGAAAAPARINTAVDISRNFRFGFMQGGVFWGWPSTHTTIAFAMATTLFLLFPKNKLVRYLAPLYALYVGLGVSVSIHWFSEFIAGAMFGTLIGVVVAKSFGIHLENTERLAIPEK